MTLYYETENCKLYQCDNLELLKTLPENYIDLIYCDVLYNTGKKFKDYDDNLGTPQEAVSWYEPRLVEMKKVLKETGSIYLQMDYRLVHYLKVKMDEIFGIKNFRNEIIWSYKSGGSSKNSYSKKHDNILFYSKSDKYLFNLQKEKSYTKAKSRKAGIVNYGGMGKAEFFEDENGVFCWINRRDVWDISYINSMASERLKYDTQKPKNLMDVIIRVSSDPNKIVADFFMGSGTTAEVALELGRKFIGCDISEKACEITRKRVERFEIQ